MVRLVSAKPPKIDGVEGGSATPSSTPAPKASTWDEVESRQQERRGMPKQPKPPVSTPSTTATSGVTPPPGAPKPDIKGEIPAFNRIGRALTKYTYIPDGRIAPWSGQLGGVNAPGRPIGTGSPGVMSPTERMAMRLSGTVSNIGSPNPFVGFKSGKLGTSRLSVLLPAGTMAATLLQERGTIVQAFVDDQYPKDVAERMADEYIQARVTTGTAAAVGAEAIGDASFIAATSAIGAAIGIFGGPGGIAAGAAAGWAVGRFIAGLSQVINIAEAALSFNSIASGGKLVNLPSVDDFWVHGGIEGKPGAFGLNLREGLQNEADTLARSEAYRVVQEIYPDRFYTDDETIREMDRIESGHYAKSVDVDPKYEAYKQFIQEGYFVFKDSRGDYKVDVEAVQTFLMSSARYKQEDDLRIFLPPKTSIGDEFYKSRYLTDDMLAGMWDVQGIMP